MTERTYTVEISASARKQLAKLDRSAQAHVLKAVYLLKLQSRPPAAKPLIRGSRWWRLRVGDYRVIYSIDEGKLLIAVVRIAHRSNIYRNFDLG